MTKDSDFLENEIFLPRPKMLQSGVMWKASHMQPGSRARFRALEALGFSVLKYAFFHFLETLFLSFLTFTSTPKMDKVVLSIWISENFLCYYTLCKFAFLMPFWKCTINDENLFQSEASVNVLYFTFQTGEKKSLQKVVCCKKWKLKLKSKLAFGTH